MTTYLRRRTLDCFAMVERKLNETLDALHGQLASAGHLDSTDRERLQQAMGEIRAILERSSLPEAGPDAPAHEMTAIERLEDFVQHLEEDHPKLTSRLVDFVESLRGMGF